MAVDPQTGGTVAPTTTPALGPEITTSDSTYGKPQKPKGKKRRRNGVVQYQWPNGSWHSRAFGKDHRDDKPAGGGGGGGNGADGHSGSGGTSGHSQTVAERALQKEINAAVRLKFGDQTDALLGQQKNMGDWFSAYRAELAKARTDSAALYGLQNGPQAPAALPQVTDPNDLGQQAAANRAALSNAFAGQQQSQGQAITSGYDQSIANSGLQEILQRKGVEKNLDSLRKDKGAFRTDFLRDKQERDRQYNLEATALDIKADPDQNGIPGDQAAASAKAGEINKYGYSNSDWQGMTPQQRKVIMKNQAKWGTSKPGEEYIYGIPASKFHHMSRAEQLTAKAEWDHAGDKGTDGGPKGKDRHGNTAVQRRANNNAWEGGLDGLRSDYPDGNYSQVTASDISSDYHVPHDIAEALLYWAKNGAHLTPKLKKRLLNLSVNFRDDGYKGVNGHSGGGGNSGYGNHG